MEGLELSHITIYDFMIFAFIFIIFIIIFLLGILSKRWIKIILLSISFILFISLPFLTIFIMHNYINKVDFKLDNAKKLVYVNAFFIDGEIINKGKKDIKQCNINIYINKNHLFQNPEYKIVFQDLKLKKNETFKFDKMIDNFSYDNYKKILIYCF